ncbi:MAG TPA: ATPase, T2SS/T4P/T4SS family [Polyangiaceae bacterium]|nr:ATPase, T2SS/T4P/T4SS family [Polyangiaceae bacterium]
MQLELYVQSPNDTFVHALDLEGRSITLGRDEGCSVRLNDEHVSRRHVTLWLENGKLRVQDSSRNGTWAGKAFLRNEDTAVPFGTPIRLGQTVISLSPARPTTEPPPPPPSRDGDPSSVPVELRREAHRLLLEHLDLGSGDLLGMDDVSLRPRVLQSLRRIVTSLASRLPEGVDIDRLVGELADEALGLGPLEELLADPSVSEIMVVDPQTVYVERRGRCERASQRFTDDDRVRAVVERIVTPLGRRIDESSPLVDARLRDGSRVNAIIRPLAIRGTCITIRKFPKYQLTLEKMIDLGSIDERVVRFLQRSVRARKNIVVAGGTGSGKTTLLNALSAAIPEHERVVTVEDSAELQLTQPHVVSLETRPANMEGKGAYTIRDLVKNALRMRPDRIVVGECRGGEALDMLQAMNTGHDGSLTTVHANSPREAVGRLETLCLMAGLELPVKAIREQIASSVNLFVQQSRYQDGTRRVSAVSEVCGIDSKGMIVQRPIYEFVQTGVDESGRVVGEFLATGYLPSYLNEFIVRGMIPEGEPYL